MQHRPLRMPHVVSGLTVILLLLVAGCGRKTAHSDIDSAIVPGADLVARFDMESIRASAILQAIKPPSNTPPALVAFWQPFWNATGLTREDVSKVLISMDMDHLDFTNGPTSPQLETLQAMIAFEMKKPITLDQLNAGAAAMHATGQGALTPITIENEPALKAAEGGVLCLQGDGRYVFIAPNEGCLGDTLKRFKKHNVASLSPAMAAAFNAVPGSPQIRAVLVLTEPLQAKLKENFQAQQQQSLTNSNLGTSMMLNMLTPMMDVTALSLGVTCASDFNLNLGCEFNTVKSATQMATDMGLGLLVLKSQQDPATSDSLTQALKISQTNALLTIDLTLNKADVALIQSLKNSGVIP